MSLAKYETPEISYVSGRNIKQIKNFDAKGYQSLKKIGVTFDHKKISGMMHAMDAIQSPVTTPSVTTPIQFLQEWLPGFVNVITAVRRIDEIVGIMTAGAWEDQEIVIGIKEDTNVALQYGDTTNIPLASWNVNFNKRTIVRMEQGMLVGILEEAQASRMMISSSAEKRASCALSLEVVRNLIGFYGYNNGSNLTYGFLNDPQLPAYVTVPNGVSGSPLWSRKTYLEIVADIKNMCQKLRTQSLDNIDPERDELTLVVATAAAEFLTQSTDFGYSVRKWINENHPKMRIISAPELNAANGGANVAYMFADTVNDTGSTDGGKTFIQVVPQKFMVTGVQAQAKGYLEDYSNATAGTILKRPWAVTRVTGI